MKRVEFYRVDISTATISQLREVEEIFKELKIVYRICRDKFFRTFENEKIEVEQTFLFFRYENPNEAVLYFLEKKLRKINIYFRIEKNLLFI